MWGKIEKFIDRTWRPAVCQLLAYAGYYILIWSGWLIPSEFENQIYQYTENIRMDIVHALVAFIIGILLYQWLDTKSKSPEGREHDTSSFIQSKDQTIQLTRDWNMGDVIQWWEKETGLNRDDGALLKLFSNLRQVARDGDIPIWGRKNSEHLAPSRYTEPLHEIPKEHWIDSDFDVLRYAYAENEDMIRDAATPPGQQPVTTTRYVDLCVNSADIKRSSQLLLTNFVSIDKSLDYVTKKLYPDRSQLQMDGAEYKEVMNQFVQKLRTGELITKGLYVGEYTQREINVRTWEFKELTLDALSPTKRRPQTRSVREMNEPELTGLEIDMNKIKKFW